MSVIDGFESRLRNRSPRLWRMYETFTERNVSFMAGSVAFSAFLSLLPLFVLLFVVLGVVGDQALIDQIVAATASFLPAQAQELLGAALRRQSGVSSTSIISIVVLGWGALRLFISLDTAFLEIYYANPDESFLDKATDSLAALGGLLIAVVAVVVASTAVAFLDVPYAGVLMPLALVVGLTVAFLPIYYFFPDVEMEVRSALPGALFAAVGWAVLQALFQVYVSYGGSGGGSGFLGGAILILTWLYFASLIVLVGAVVNAVLSNDVRSVDVDDRNATSMYGAA
ncbi:YihY/virulence factor BrkB family protein [Halorubellus sp. JP-L1]|uniref:YihY/virulence factor BrkB family protein n=1 Tax=Halorubellus sp. JP-L1 TaxID=2715753 RepID=UPI00140DEC2A|nr:YihY/virulence factor BrkB family protein [Halorubellus sp. JP-L1]NHN42699.1 YihY/virulence factor BrkB family protein [Halorubellus sp. JP-L1]